MSAPASWLQAAWHYDPAPTMHGLPQRYTGVTIDGIPQGSAVQRATVAFLTDFERQAGEGRAPVYVGRARQYKSYAAAVIVQQVHAIYKLSAAWIDAPSTLLTVERTRYQTTSQRVIDYWKKVPLLVVDDFAAVAPASYAGQLVVELCTSRFNAQKPTIWTGNIALPPDDPYRGLAQAWGPTFARRIEETGRGMTAAIG